MRGLRGSRKPSGSAWRRAPVAELEFEPLGVLSAVLPFPHLVLASAVGLAPAGLMAFAHGVLLPWASMGSRGESLGCTQTRAPGSRVGGDLGVGRRDRWPGDETEARIASADADRQLGRADAAATLGLEEPLDDPVLERVVAEDDEAAPGSEEVEGGCQTGRQRVELLVDGDPQRLEDPGRGMRPAAEARVRRQRLARRGRRAPRRSRPARSCGHRRSRGRSAAPSAPRRIVGRGRSARRRRARRGARTPERRDSVSKRMSSGPPARKPKPRLLSAS